jgi:hypothetical protein
MQEDLLDSWDIHQRTLMMLFDPIEHHFYRQNSCRERRLFRAIITLRQLLPRK